MIPSLFLELSAIILLAVVITGLMRLLKQPLLIGYIITGVVASPYLLNIIRSTEAITILSHLGITLLLFMVGLHLNPRVIKSVGGVAFVTGLLQVALTFAIGFWVARLFNFSPISSVYIGFGVAFSSTIIILKLLSDKQNLGTLYGGISIGILILQDLVAIFLLMVISSVQNGDTLSTIAINSVLKGIGIVALLILVSIYVLPKVLQEIAKSQEYLFLFSIGWCLALASLFYYMNFSIEIGALLAGVTLSLSPFHYEIEARMKPLRDFFLVLFFVLIGAQMDINTINQYIIPAIILAAVVLLVKPIIIMAIMGLNGYTKRNGFYVGSTLGQMSEFSIILALLGVQVGHIGPEILALITVAAVITFAASTYYILYTEKLYNLFSKYLTIFERKGKKVDVQRAKKDKYDVIMFGHNRVGFNLLESFKDIKKKFLVVDFNPEIISMLIKEGFPCMYGDAGDTELLDELNFAKARMIISTVPDFDVNILIINKIKRVNKKAPIIVVSHQIDEAMRLYDAGASYVIMPHFLGGHQAGTMIKEYGFKVSKFLKEKVAHVEHLKMRKQYGHEHPKNVR